MDMELVVKKLKEKGVVFTKGITKNEIIEIEEFIISNYLNIK
ncbi:hypothetical protein ACFVR2_01485 [Gottfriedia sp. NPDC057991]